MRVFEQRLAELASLGPLLWLEAVGWRPLEPRRSDPRAARERPVAARVDLGPGHPLTWR